MSLVTFPVNPPIQTRSKRKAQDEAKASSITPLAKRMHSPEQSWQKGESFWLTRGIISHGHPPALRHKLTMWLKDETSEVEGLTNISKKDSEELKKIDQMLFFHNLPPFLEIRMCKKISSLGAFAKEFLPKDKVLGAYAGLIYEIFDCKFEDHYIFGLTETFIVDAKIKGNYTRFFNSAVPAKNANVKAWLIKIKGKIQVLFKTIKDVQLGEQLLIDYSDAVEDWGLAKELSPEDQ